MALEEFYGSITGDLNAVRGFLPNDESIMKFLKMFFEEPVYGELCTSIEADDLATAFRAAHTMKGLAIGMGFTGLHDASSQLTEALRPNDAGVPTAPENVPELFDRVKQEYSAITEAYQQSF